MERSRTYSIIIQGELIHYSGMMGFRVAIYNIIGPGAVHHCNYLYSYSYLPVYEEKQNSNQTSKYKDVGHHYDLSTGNASQEGRQL